MDRHTSQDAVTEPAPAPSGAIVAVAGPTSSAMILGLALRDVRMSARQLATAMGLNKNTVQAWLNGTQSVSLANVMRMPVSLRKRIAARLDEHADEQMYRTPLIPTNRGVTLATMSLGEYARVVYEAEADGIIDKDEHAVAGVAARKAESILRLAAVGHEMATFGGGR
jgi:hypothetical protein